MSPCEQMEQAVLDETLARPGGFEAHLASCDACRALGAAHREALRLRGLSLGRSRRRPLAEVQRRAGIVAGLVLALGGGLGLYQLEFGSRPAPAVVEHQPVRLELAMPVLVQNAPEGDFFALALLQASVTADLSRDPRDDEAATRAFGALPRWTAPRRTHPMRSLGRVASPVVYTSEDSP
ncbi:MAG: hypothetical protein Q8L48_36460 [Archangium sp.]|nr:hypothetical protein [Archangium sp.]